MHAKSYEKVTIPESIRTETQDELAKRTARFGSSDGGQYFSVPHSDRDIESREDTD